MLLPHVFNAEVIYDQREADGPPVVRPQSRCYLALIVPVGIEALLKEFLRQDAGLRQAVHSPLDGNKNVPISGGAFP